MLICPKCFTHSINLTSLFENSLFSRCLSHHLEGFNLFIYPFTYIYGSEILKCIISVVFIKQLQQKLVILEGTTARSNGESETLRSENIAPSNENSEIEFFLKLISKADMYNDAMAQMNLDKQKYSFGNLKRIEILEGFDILKRLQNEISKEPSNAQNLSLIFYDTIKHELKPEIKTSRAIEEKLEMLQVLLDIYNVQENFETIEKKQLKLNLEVKDFKLVKCESWKKLIEAYVNNTTTKIVQIVSILEFIRQSKGDQDQNQEEIKNKTLLWHGTNIARVYNILLNGLIRPSKQVRNESLLEQKKKAKENYEESLKIEMIGKEEYKSPCEKVKKSKEEYRCACKLEESKMSNYRSLFGEGIYFASLFDKAAKYVICDKDGYGVIFLNEVALGNVEKVTELKEEYKNMTEPNKGYNSIVGQGRFEHGNAAIINDDQIVEQYFDPTENEQINFNNNKVLVPIGKTILVPKDKTDTINYSQFCHNEYVIYEESRCRIRYVLTCKFTK